MLREVTANRLAKPRVVMLLAYHDMSMERCSIENFTSYILARERFIGQSKGNSDSWSNRQVEELGKLRYLGEAECWIQRMKNGGSINWEIGGSPIIAFAAQRNPNPLDMGMKV